MLITSDSPKSPNNNNTDNNNSYSYNYNNINNDDKSNKNNNSSNSKKCVDILFVVAFLCFPDCFALYVCMCIH